MDHDSSSSQLADHTVCTESPLKLLRIRQMLIFNVAVATKNTATGNGKKLSSFR
jgi:hypothetical protein